MAHEGNVVIRIRWKGGRVNLGKALTPTTTPQSSAGRGLGGEGGTKEVEERNESENTFMHAIYFTSLPLIHVLLLTFNYNKISAYFLYYCNDS